MGDVQTVTSPPWLAMIRSGYLLDREKRLGTFSEGLQEVPTEASQRICQLMMLVTLALFWYDSTNKRVVDGGSVFGRAMFLGSQRPF
jgi:hypothetical protein